MTNHVLAQDTLGDLSDRGDSAFAKANSFYQNENYQEAIVSYERILQSGKQSAEVYFNLGNAHYKANQVGPAIWNFEKALQLDPGDSDTTNNLKFAQQLRVDDVQPLAVNPVKRFLTDIVNSLSVDNWAYISIMLALVAVLFFLLYHYANNTAKKRLFFTLSMVVLLGMALAIISAAYAQNLRDENIEAIVFTKETVTRAEPKDNAEPSFAIHEGTKVRILEEYKKWARVELANGSQSWMPLTDFKKL